MDSLALSGDWDLILTPGGNLAVVSGPERIAQDVACYVSIHAPAWGATGMPPRTACPTS